MKHSIKITILLLAMFFVTQLIGLGVLSLYHPNTITTTVNGTVQNYTSYNLPYGLEPPQGVEPGNTLISFVFSLFFAVIIILLLMKFKAAIFLKFWFLIVITLALGITLNAFLMNWLPMAGLVAIIIGFILALIKVYQRNIIIHNATELLIYPGIAAIFVPLLNVWTVAILLILISIYDIYAVWQAGFMQKMAKYQIQNLKIFSGFFVPYLGAKERKLVQKMKASKSKSMKDKKIKVSVAILGGGDVVFPIILAGVVLIAYGLLAALIISIGATIALGLLFYYSEKGKFYPAMPFISAGCFVALAIVFLLNLMNII